MKTRRAAAGTVNPRASTVSACTRPYAATLTTARRSSNCAAPSPARRRKQGRVQCNAAGQVVLRLKTPWRDGTTHQGTPSLEFMRRLSALAIEERPLVSLAQTEAAPDPLSRRAGSQRQAARAGGAARTAGARPGRAARRRGRLPVGRSCKRPDHPDQSLFRRPGTRGRGDRLRPGFAGPRQSGRMTWENSESAATNDALRRCRRHSTGRSRPQRPHQ